MKKQKNFAFIDSQNLNMSFKDMGWKLDYQAVIVTGDGDFHCLVNYLLSKNKLQKLLIPNQIKYSALLKRFPSGCLGFLSDLKKKVAYKKKEPRKE